MPSFARHDGLYGALIITGPRSVLLRLAFGPERVESPVLAILRPDARFGDPETQAYLPRLQNDLVELLSASIDGHLDRIPMKWYPMASLCVVIASESYPGSSPKGRPIHGLDGLAQQPGLQVFHAGTTLKDGQVVTSGGRVLGVTAWAPSLIEAQKAAYSACDQICFEGMQFRRDIGAKGLVRT